MAQENKQKSASAPRNLWGERETAILIDLWEDRLSDLRRQKRNGGVYEEIAEALRQAGFIRTRVQVHNKIENLGQTYRSWLRKRTTGAGGVTWEHFWRIHKFLGSLPVNDPSTAQESDISVEQIILGMENGDTDDHVEQSPNPLDESLLQNSSDADPEIAASPAGSPTAVASTSATASCTSAPVSRKRKRGTTSLADVHAGLLQEQKILRESLLAARAKEYEQRERQIALQEKLVNAFEKYFSK